MAALMNTLMLAVIVLLFHAAIIAVSGRGLYLPFGIVIGNLIHILLSAVLLLAS